MNHQDYEGLSFGRLLKAFRERGRIFKQAGLAAKIGVSERSVSGWEEDKRLPNIKKRREIVLSISGVLELSNGDTNLLLHAAKYRWAEIESEFLPTCVSLFLRRLAQDPDEKPSAS